MKLCFESTRTTWKVLSLHSLSFNCFPRYVPLSFHPVRENAVARSEKVALLIGLQNETNLHFASQKHDQRAGNGHCRRSIGLSWYPTEAISI